MGMSEPLSRLPVASFDYVFASPKVYPKARAWMASNRGPNASTASSRTSCKSLPPKLSKKSIN